MRIFEKFPQKGNELCPICKTRDDGQCILIGLDHTMQEGTYTIEAVPTHTKCLELFYNVENGIIYTKVPNDKPEDIESDKPSGEAPKG